MTPPDWGEGLEQVPDHALRLANRDWTLARALSDVVHALNNSLQVMSGSAELLEARLPDGDPSRPRLTAIRQQAERAAATIGDLLAYARAVPGERRTVDVSRACDVALAMRAHSLSRQRIIVAREPSAAVQALVASPPAVLQLLLNVLLFVERRVQSGGEVRLSVADDRGAVRVRVSARLASGDPLPQEGTGADGVAQRRVFDLLGRDVGGAVRVGAGDGTLDIEVELPAAPRRE